MSNTKNTMFVMVASPTKVVFDGEAQKVVAPTLTGIIGILPHHEPYVSVLDVGTLEVTINDKETITTEVNGGLVEVRPDNKVVVLLRSIRNDHD